MGPTTSYGTWNNHVDRYASGVAHSVMESFGSYGADDYDFDAIVADYRDAINEALPDSVVLAGDEFIGPYQPDADEFDGYPTDEDGRLDITAIVADVDLGEITERHELWTIEQVAERLKYTSPSAKATARKRLSAWGVKAAMHRQNEGSGRVQALYRAREVEAAKEARPGRGVGGGRRPKASA